MVLFQATKNRHFIENVVLCSKQLGKKNSNFTTKVGPVRSCATDSNLQFLQFVLQAWSLATSQRPIFDLPSRNGSRKTRCANPNSQRSIEVSSTLVIKSCIANKKMFFPAIDRRIWNDLTLINHIRIGRIIHDYSIIITIWNCSNHTSRLSIIHNYSQLFN